MFLLDVSGLFLSVIGPAAFVADGRNACLTVFFVVVWPPCVDGLFLAMCFVADFRWLLSVAVSFSNCARWFLSLA